MLGHSINYRVPYGFYNPNHSIFFYSIGVKKHVNRNNFPHNLYRSPARPFFDLASHAFQLCDYVALYIPSTVDTDKGIDNTLETKNCQAFLASLFGGASTYPIVGSWVSEKDGSLVNESVNVVKAFCTPEAFADNLEAVYNYATSLKIRMTQEAVSLETSRHGLCLI